MVLYDEDDPLYTLISQRAAHRKLKEIYTSAGKKEKYVGKFYPGEHKFDSEMQKDAFKWLKKVLNTSNSKKKD